MENDDRKGNAAIRSPPARRTPLTGARPFDRDR